MSHILTNNNKASSPTKHLQSEIINQKKQFIFKVEQTSDFVYPNEEYKYYIYLKNISGVDINNIHIIVNNPSNVDIDSAYQDEGYINIGTMKNDEVKMIYLSALCNTTGTFFNHFICYGDNTGLFYKTLKINCSYNNVSDEVIHRIHIYNFTPYEDTYMMEVDDFSDQVTQLFKTQKLPYKAKEQPFPMQHKDSEITVRPFSNVESESFVSQYDEINLKGFLDNISQKKEIYDSARNTKEHYYQYIGRENFNENSLESFEGENLFNIIENINNNSQYFKATFLKTGNNQLLNDFKEYNPDGFIYRFGLLSSEIYHHLGVLPTYSYMSDYLFRWAPSKNQPLNLIPQKKAMNWNQHKWAGHGWRVYRIATKEYMETDEWKQKLADGIEDRWSIIEDFENLESAKNYVERQKNYDEEIKSQLCLEYDRYEYLIRESFFDTGVFYINIPLDKIPTNFYLLNTEDIEAIIQKSKPFGVKPLIRYSIEKIFTHSPELSFYPILKPHIDIDIDKMDEMTYFIQTKKYKEVVEKICNTNVVSTKLVPYGKTLVYNGYMEEDMQFIKEDLHPRIVQSDLSTTNLYLNKHYPCPYNNNKVCQNNNQCVYNQNGCQYRINTNTTPNHNVEIDIAQENQVDVTITDNDLSKLLNLTQILYQNNCDNIGFSTPFRVYHKPRFINNISSQNNFVTDWAKNNNFKSFDFKIEKTSTNNYKLIGDDLAQTYNIFRAPIINREKFNNFGYELGIGVLDGHERYHYLSTNYDTSKQMDFIKYSTSFNNNYYTQKNGYQNITGISFCIFDVEQKQLVVFFVEENGADLHYFHHIIVSNISDIFIYMSNELINKNDSVINYLNCDKINNNVDVCLETPFVYTCNFYEPFIIKNGKNWTNLYRIDSAQNSYTYIDNLTNNVIQPDNILLHFDDINIPANSIIKEIKLKTIMDSKTTLNIQARCACQTNNEFEEPSSNVISFIPNNIECYPANKKSQYQYQEDMKTAVQYNNEKTIQEIESNIKKNILFDETVKISLEDYIQNYDDFVDIKKGFWIELSDFTRNPNNCNNVKTLDLYLEGYNEGSEVNLSYQSLCLNESRERQRVKIESGYFYKKISIPFINSFTLDNLRIKFKFDNLNHNIKLFNSYLNIDFKQKEKQLINYIFTDDISIRNKQNININCFDESFTPERINNGLSIDLSFDELSPGEYYRIYSAELNIIYQETDMNMLINKNQFTYTNYLNNYISISGINDDTYMSGIFYNDVATVLQLESTIDADNHGLELKDALFQSFIARDNNITSIELFPNGFVGNPDDTIKIGLYSNHGNTPGHLIKEVYAHGWTKSNSQLKNLYSIKYNFNIDNLEIDKQYWIKIEIDNPNENSYYLLRYTTEKQKDLKLLLKENNDYINTFGCLEFNIYSKNLSRSFYQLPTVQDYFNNPYILIGLHKGVGKIKNLRVKKRGDS